MKPHKFIELAREAGFSAEMADFLLENLSQKPHTHTADQITDLNKSVRGIVEEVEEEEMEEEDEEDEEE